MKNSLFKLLKDVSRLKYSYVTLTYIVDSSYINVGQVGRYQLEPSRKRRKKILTKF